MVMVNDECAAQLAAISVWVFGEKIPFADCTFWISGELSGLLLWHAMVFE
jgi:hypothetical protein